MNISQENWDSIWENSAGEQQRLFDEDGSNFPDRRITLFRYLPILKIPVAFMKTSKNTL